MKTYPDNKMLGERKMVDGKVRSMMIHSFYLQFSILQNSQITEFTGRTICVVYLQRSIRFSPTSQCLHSLMWCNSSKIFRFNIVNKMCELFLSLNFYFAGWEMWDLRCKLYALGYQHAGSFWSFIGCSFYTHVIMQSVVGFFRPAMLMVSTVFHYTTL